MPCATGSVRTTGFVSATALNSATHPPVGRYRPAVHTQRLTDPCALTQWSQLHYVRAAKAAAVAHAAVAEVLDDWRQQLASPQRLL